MFGVDSIELIIVAIAALLFIGPKELPSTMRAVGRWAGKIRGMARHFTSGIEAVMREAELEEMDRKWREENERILALHPANADYPEPAMRPLPAPSGAGEDQPPLPLEAPAAPDDDPTPPSERRLP
jgi:sec-independent protein translocase protein TatB